MKLLLKRYDAIICLLRLNLFNGPYAQFLGESLIKNGMNLSSIQTGYVKGILHHMVVQILENLKKLGNKICAREKLGKSGSFNEKAQDIFCVYLSLKTMPLRLKIPFGTFKLYDCCLEMLGNF